MLDLLEWEKKYFQKIAKRLEKEINDIQDTYGVYHVWTQTTKTSGKFPSRDLFARKLSLHKYPKIMDTDPRVLRTREERAIATLEELQLENDLFF